MRPSRSSIATPRERGHAVADPQRIVDDPDASPLARSLLASASADAPTAEHRATLAKRLGLAAVLVAAGGGEVGAGTVGVALWWKAGLLVLALGGAITGGVLMTRESAPEVPQVAVMPVPVPAAPVLVSAAPVPVIAEPAPPAVTERTMVPPAAAPTAAPPLRAIAPSPLPAAPTTVAPPPRAIAPSPPAATQTAPATAEPPPATASAERLAATTTAEPPPATPASALPPPPPPSPPAAPAVDARRLAAEVAILDRARTALRRGDPAAAAAALDAHAREFADGALVAEAELVRIETLVRRGDTAAARERARGFLIRFPQSPLAKRLRSLVDRLPTAAKESP